MSELLLPGVLLEPLPVEMLRERAVPIDLPSQETLLDSPQGPRATSDIIAGIWEDIA